MAGLNALGEKIFLDRYAMKETDRSNAKAGDTVVVTTIDHPKWPTRAIGKIVNMVAPGRVRVEWTNQDGSIERRDFATDQVDICRETHDQAMQRVARGLAEVEPTLHKVSFFTAEFYSVLSNCLFVPAGRILTGAGSGLNVTYFNCYVLPAPHDSRKGIVERLGQTIETLARGGGVGLNFSSLRPRTAIINGTMGRSSGSVSWANIYSHSIKNVSQGGSRRGAGMAQWSLYHPDVPEVINCKRTPGYMEGFNISLRVPKAFMDCLEADGMWEFLYPDTEHPAYDTEWKGNYREWMAKGYPLIKYGEIPARELWQTMMQASRDSAEPGVVFEDTIEDFSNSWYIAPLDCTNPCGEQPLDDWSVCDLGHIHLGRMSDGPVGKAKVNWERLERTVRLGVRMLDNVVDATPYFFQENEDKQKSLRRIGLGTLGLGELLIRLGIRYGKNKRCIDFLNILYSEIVRIAYEEGIEIAKEKGAFPGFDADKFLQSGFIKNLIGAFPHLEEGIRKYGVRNVTYITQAPTGTVGTMVDTSTGIEPFFALQFTRQSRLGVDKQFASVVKEWMEENPGQPLPDFMVGAMDITGEDHLYVQAIIQFWTDSACSKTCNLPAGTSVEEVSRLYKLAYQLGCKGFTVYVDQSRYEQVLHLDKKEQADPLAVAQAGESAMIDDWISPIVDPHDIEHWHRTRDWNCPNGGALHAESGCYSCSCGEFAVCGG